MPLLPLTFLIAELFIVGAAACAALRRRGYSVPAALALSLALSKLALSFLYQSAFLIGYPDGALAMELGLMAYCLWRLRNESMLLRGIASRIGAFVRSHRELSAALGIIWGHLGLLALFVPPSNGDSMRVHLARALLFQQEASLLLDVTTPQQAHRAVYPVGYDVLFHSLLRFQSDYGVALFGFMGYLTLVLGGYALARRFASPTASLVGALVVGSLTEIVYQATSTKGDLELAAIGVSAMIVGCRLIRRPSSSDLALLVLLLTYGLSVKVLFAPFGLAWGAATLFLGAREHGWRLQTPLRLWKIATLLPVLAVTSQCWLFAHNYTNYGHPLGPPEFLASSRNQDGLRGAVANSLRYSLQLADPLKATDQAVEQVTGRKISEILQAAWDALFAEKLDGVGTSSTFKVSTSADESKAWFGPLALLLIVPASMYAAVSGPAQLRGILASQFFYFAVVCWQVEWMQWNGRFFSLCFAGVAAIVAFAVDRTFLCSHRSGLTGVAILLMIYASAFSSAKPLLPLVADPGLFIRSAATDNIWAVTRWGRERDHFFADPRALDGFEARIPPGSSVLIAPSHPSGIYPFLRRCRDCVFSVIDPDRIEQGIEELPSDAPGFLVCVGPIGCEDLRMPSLKDPVCYDLEDTWSSFCMFSVDG